VSEDLRTRSRRRFVCASRIHLSDGDPSANGILGARVPRFGHDGWRMFWTQQHGDNVTWEVTRPKHGDNDDDRGDW